MPHPYHIHTISLPAKIVLIVCLAISAVAVLWAVMSVQRFVWDIRFLRRHETTLNDRQRNSINDMVSTPPSAPCLPHPN